MRLIPLVCLLLMGCAGTTALQHEEKTLQSTDTPGLASGPKSHFSYTVEAKAGAEQLWALWMDVDSWNRWDKGLRRAESPEALSLGAQGVITPLSGPESRFTVTEFEPSTRYTFETRLPLARLSVSRSIVASDARHVVFVHEVSFRGALGWMWAQILGGSFREMLPSSMHALARLAEQRGGP